MTWPQFRVDSYSRIGYTAIMGLGTMHSRAIETCDAAPATAPGGARPPKLLDRLREALRARHHSRRAEQTYIMWVRGPESCREGGQEPGRYGLRGSGRRAMRKPYKTQDIEPDSRNTLSYKDLRAFSGCVLYGTSRRSASNMETR